jgi:hypothetical protein
LQAAVEVNRVRVLEILVEHRAGVKERLQNPTLHSNDPQKIEQHLSETPLHIAVREKAYEAAAWLLKHGASRSIQDSHHQSADDLVAWVVVRNWSRSSDCKLKVVHRVSEYMLWYRWLFDSLATYRFFPLV